MNDALTHLLVKLTSKKLIAVLVSVLTLVQAKQYPYAAGVAVAYLTGQSVIDARGVASGSPIEEDPEDVAPYKVGFSAPNHEGDAAP